MILQTSVEVCRDRLIIPTGLNYQRLEIGLIFRDWSPLLDSLECPLGLHLLVSSSKQRLHFLEQFLLGGHNGPRSRLQFLPFIVKVILQMRLDPFPRSSPHIGGDEQELLLMGVKLIHVQINVYLTLELELFHLVAPTVKLDRGVNLDRSFFRSSDARSRRGCLRWSHVEM